MTAPPRFESGGGGLLSTIGDYARFVAMLSGGGALDGARILGSRTIAFMASDHLAANVVKNHYLLWPGHGFGLGFCVRTEPGLAPTAGSVGEYFWGGVAGHGVLDLAARRAVRDPDGAGARIPRVFPRAVPQPRQRRDRMKATTTRPTKPTNVIPANAGIQRCVHDEAAQTGKSSRAEPSAKSY